MAAALPTPTMTPALRDWIEMVRARDATSLARCVKRRAPDLPRPAPPAEGAPYARTLLARASDGEVMLAAWRPGARSAPHDHGDAEGVVVVLAGAFDETRFDFAEGSLRRDSERRYRAWDTLAAPRGIIHQMGTESGGYTLHVYAPCIQGMRLYDVARRATLLVTGDTGAWLDERSGAEAVAWHA